MKNKILITAAFLLMISGLSLAMFFAIKYSKNRSLSSLWLSSLTHLGTVSPSIELSPTASSTAEEIIKLKEEVERLKNQPPQIIYKTTLVPTTNSPSANGLKTQEELTKAKDQISSLEEQLKQVQVQQSQQAVAAPSESDLINSWKAEDKVVRIACQDKFFETWQFGSGVLISADGKILTNEHVVKPSMGLALPDYCLALFSKDYDAQKQSYNKQYRATLVGFFQDRDAAILKIQDVLTPEGTAVRVLPATETFSYFSSTTVRPQIGQTVYAIGFPESARFAFSVTKGIISNLPTTDVYFGTDAQIDRGNSGGAAVNSAGQLIGLPTWKFASGGDYRGYILDINSINL